MADVPVGDQAGVAALLARASHARPAAEANRAIDEMRGQWSGGAPSFSYEVALWEGRGWTYLRDSVAPSLVRYLRSKHMTVDSCSAVFLSIFAGESLYFVGAAEFFEHFRRAEGCSVEALREKARAWENGRP